ARALKLFGEANGQHAIDVIETHPHGAFRFLNQVAGGDPLAPKTTQGGRQQRIEILQAFVDGVSADLLLNHDAVDAACAAWVAALHVVGQTYAFGTPEGRGIIWMPDSRLSTAVQELVSVGRADSSALPPSLIDERTAWRILTSSREDWERT